MVLIVVLFGQVANVGHWLATPLVMAGEVTNVFPVLPFALRA